MRQAVTLWRNVLVSTPSAPPRVLIWRTPTSGPAARRGWLYDALSPARLPLPECVPGFTSPLGCQTPHRNRASRLGRAFLQCVGSRPMRRAALESAMRVDAATLGHRWIALAEPYRRVGKARSLQSHRENSDTVHCSSSSTFTRAHRLRWAKVCTSLGITWCGAVHSSSREACVA